MSKPVAPTARTADNVEVGPGDTVWVSTSESRVVREVDPDCASSGAVLINRPWGQTSPAWWPMEQVWSTRLRALTAARDRAVAEVARLTAEIAKESSRG